MRNIIETIINLLKTIKELAFGKKEIAPWSVEFKSLYKSQMKYALTLFLADLTDEQMTKIDEVLDNVVAEYEKHYSENEIKKIDSNILKDFRQAPKKFIKIAYSFNPQIAEILQQ